MLYDRFPMHWVPRSARSGGGLLLFPIPRHVCLCSPSFAQCFLAGLSWTVFDDLGIVFRYGMAGLASTCSEWWAFETVGIGATYLGEASQASTAIYVLSMGVGCNALAGIGVAAAVWIGNLLGQNRPQHAAASAQVVQYLSGTFVTCNAIILISVKNCFGRLFSEDAEVIRLVNRNVSPSDLFEAAFRLSVET